MAQAAYALITGASSGIGESFARTLAARRRNLVLVARSKEKLESLAADLRAAHAILAEALPADLSAPGAAAGLTRKLEERGLEIDLLVNNAGFGAQGRFWQLALDRQLEMLRLNVNALVELTYLLLPRMVEQRRGALINVSSTASFQPVPYIATYAATKAFVASFSMALAEEVREYGVKVVTLCPGGTRTNFFDAGQYRRRKFPGGLQPAEEVVAAALRGLDRGGGLVVPRFLNKASVFVQRLVPRSAVMKVSADLFRPVDDPGAA
ncbi:MAG TPA: SDR family oxidoreductase [Terriglobia bacterium]|nr:SDR family oxidoreductase [Terriglobia bacterium]